MSTSSNSCLCLSRSEGCASQDRAESSRKCQLQRWYHNQELPTIFRKRLTKNMQKLYVEKYKTLLPEIKDDLNKWGDTWRSQVGRLGIKMLSLPGLSSVFATTLIRIPAEEIDQLILKFLWKFTGPRVSKAVLIFKKSDGGKLSDFKSYKTNQDSLVLAA